MFVVLEAMADAGVLAELPRAATQDMAIYTMLVRMMPRHANMLIYSLSVALCERPCCVCDYCRADVQV